MLDLIEIFCNWCRQKILLQVSPRSETLFKQGELWWCKIGMNVGDEIFGKGEKFCRPVLVYKKLSGTTFLGLPVTMREKTGTWYVEFRLHDARRWALLNQARVFDSRRLLDRIGVLSAEEMTKLKSRFIGFYQS